MTPLQTISIPEPTISTDADGVLSHDLYREVHKAIRFAMFHATMNVGSLDVTDLDAVADVAQQCAELIELLELHHHHEDGFVQALVQLHAPDLALVIETQHLTVEEGMATLRVLVAALVDATPTDRPMVAHRLYLELTRFTAAYLEHQLCEEQRVMPALCRSVDVADLEALHMELKQSIAPDVMARFMMVMLPAMNIDERADMLGGMSMAPPPVWAIFRGAAEAALTPAQFAVVVERIGLN
jgi:hypothetical protein